jgi:hypothetical protein
VTDIATRLTDQEWAFLVSVRDTGRLPPLRQRGDLTDSLVERGLLTVALETPDTLRYGYSTEPLAAITARAAKLIGDPK